MFQLASLEERLERLEAALGNASQDKLVGNMSTLGSLEHYDSALNAKWFYLLLYQLEHRTISFSPLDMFFSGLEICKEHECGDIEMMLIFINISFDKRFSI